VEEFFTWSGLATYAGALVATILVTQLFKEVSFIQKLPTRIFSWIVAFAILILANLFTGALTWGSAVLSLVNAVIVSLAANGGYDFITTEAWKKK
jgi:hypothetical protein